MPAGARRIMRRFSMEEISGVDRPAQKGAKVAIMKRADAWDDSSYIALRKRDFSTEQRRHAERTGAAMPGGRYPIEDAQDLHNAIRAVGRGKGSHAAIRAHIMRRARALGLSDQIPDDWKSEKFDVAKALDQIDAAYVLRKAVTFDQQQAVQENNELAQGLMQEVYEASSALCTVLYEIAGDNSVSDKGKAMNEALADFSEHVKRIVPEGIETGIVAAALQQAGYRINAQGGIELANEGADQMALADIAKKLGLPTTASEAEILKAMDDAEAKAKAKEKEEAEKAKGATSKAYDGLTSVEKSYIGNGTMPEGGWDAFALMKSEDRAAHMKAKPAKKPNANANASDDDEGDMDKALAKGDAFRTPQGVFVKRSDFTSAAAYDVAKSQNETIAKQAEAIANAEDDAARGRIAKRAAVLKNVGAEADITSLVRSIEKHDAKLGEQVMAKFEQLDGVIAKGELFAETGSGARGATFGKAGETVQKKAEELRKKDPAKFKSIEKARDHVRQTEPELAKEEARERAEQQASRRAA